jgi:hypothetical protein
MSVWAQQVKFIGTIYNEGTFHFTYDIDGKELTIDLSHSIASNLPISSIEKIGFNLGMCYLIDLLEIVLPKKVWVYKKLPPLAFNYWKTLFSEVVVEKLYARKLPSSMKYVAWESGDDEEDVMLQPFPEGRDHAALCLTGGKESLAILKTLEGKKPLLLFFLNPEPNIHRQKAYNAVKDSFLTTKTISNREDIFAPLEKKYQGMLSGVDMAHLVFNTMLYADKCEYVLIGNEYSSNFPNDVYEGNVVNHQYVKTIHFAENINKYVHEFVTKDFSYHSPFFGMYEFLIADLLFKNDKYLDVWTSCNQTTPELNFCSNCYKCAFTYLIARTKKSDEYLLKFFSRNMLEDVKLFKPMMDFTGTKPLDCVGDKTEVWVCLETLYNQDVSNAVIDYYLGHIRPAIIDELPKYIQQITTVQRVPVSFPKDIDDIFSRALPR